MSIFVTADWHYGHDRIRELCHRSFSSVDEMNKTLIDNWNKEVKEQDTVYILGDFVWRENVALVLDQLPGKKVMILGGHDEKRLLKWQFVPTYEYLELKYNEVTFVLFHYPIENWNKMYHGSIHLHGHSHGNSRPRKNRWDVGVDIFGFFPVNLDYFLSCGEYDREFYLREESQYQ